MRNIDLHLHKPSILVVEKMAEVSQNCCILKQGNDRKDSAWAAASCSLSVTQILPHPTRTKFLINSLSNQLKTEHIHNPSQMQQFFKLLTFTFFCKLKSYFCGTDTRRGGERTRLYLNLNEFANTLYIHFPRKGVGFQMKQWRSFLETGL